MPIAKVAILPDQGAQVGGEL